MIGARIIDNKLFLALAEASVARIPYITRGIVASHGSQSSRIVGTRMFRLHLLY